MQRCGENAREQSGETEGPPIEFPGACAFCEDSSWQDFRFFILWVHDGVC